jgi:hypothetical protein
MKKYVKKPVVIEAIIWNGNKDQVIDFCGLKAEFMKSEKDSKLEVLYLNTLEGSMLANIGDYLIKGVKGEFYPCKPDIFALSYDEVASEITPVATPKTLKNTDSNGAKKNVKDIEFWGNGDTFKLISKASSENEGWFKSTKAMQIDGIGCVIQTTTQQRNPDGSYSLTDSTTFAPNTKIEEQFSPENENIVIGRTIVNIQKSIPVKKN